MNKARQFRDDRRDARAAQHEAAQDPDNPRAAPAIDEMPIGPGDLEIEFVREDFMPGRV